MENYQMVICAPQNNGDNFTEIFKLKNIIKDVILQRLFQAVNQNYENQINIISENNDPTSLGFIFRGDRYRRTNIEPVGAKDFVQLNKELHAKADRIIIAHKTAITDSKNIETMLNALFTNKFDTETIVSALPPELYDLIKECFSEDCQMYNPSLYKEKKIYLMYKPVIQRYLGTLLLCQ